MGPGADTLFAHIKSDFAAIGLSVKRVERFAPADLRLIDTVARYPRADWYLSQFACAAGNSLCSPQTDAKAALARSEPQPAKRAAALEDAETALTLSNMYIPLGSPIRWSLVRGKLAGFSTNTRGYHPLTPVSVHPK
jgi:peptide/nickel transport system substrate-binding protein/oligopeptide transport system substrate-binding protein